MTRTLAALLAAALLAGCATQAPLTSAAGKARAAALARLHNWTADGRLGVSDGRQSWQASFHWRQQGDHYAIDLIGPFGQGQLAIRGGPGSVTLRDGQRVLQAADPESLLAEAGIAPVPVSGLRYWLLGEPAPNPPATPVRGSEGYLRQLAQSGWQIVYPNYITVQGLALPQRVQAERNALQVKLYIGQWTLH